ncbi:MAG TPA: class I SAM-dependent methyltransferase [Saprospiraceae bacterium]|nr:class I SAM-dependent methyltransferase [Saprospiraceae bacterium]
MTKQEKAVLREEIFRHLDGIATAATAYTLYEKGVLAYLLEKQQAGLSELTTEFKANEGYLNVALRLLCSQGWLQQHIDNKTDIISYAINENSKPAFELVPLYKDVVHLMKFSENYHPRKFELEPFNVLKAIFDKYRANYGLKDNDSNPIQKQVLKHIEGILVGPTLVHLGMGGMFHKYFMEASFRPEEYHKHPESFKELLDFLSYLGWFISKNETYRFTEKGLFFAQRASAYGVTVSYIPTFRKLDELIFGNPLIFSNLPKGSPELHVDREMNVWGSGGAHTTYFNKVDEVIIELFNKPIGEQPRGILDMGCGNGAFLKHIYEVIEKRTLRGQILEEHPIFLVGADFNEAALRVTRTNLIQADIWAKIIWGDIGRPDILAKDLLEDYGIELSDLLNVRTFLDHNRPWENPKTIKLNRISSSTGAFAYKGKRINNNLVEDNLLAHFKKWAPYIDKFGLLVIELHTLDPLLASKNLGKTAVTAYDGTHGFSDQYIVEIAVFHKIAIEAGLKITDKYLHKFPDSELATVSINLLKSSS